MLGLYQGRLEDASGGARRFRLQLFAESPDRVHAEVLLPVGGTAWVLDGGGGRLAVTDVRRGVSYVGLARPEALEQILGIRLPLEDLVRGLLIGPPLEHSDCRVSRSGGAEGTLPDHLELRCSGGVLSLRLRRREPLQVSAATLGTGQAPPRTTERPLEELRAIDDEPGGEAR